MKKVIVLFRLGFVIKVMENPICFLNSILSESQKQKRYAKILNDCLIKKKKKKEKKELTEKKTVLCVFICFVCFLTSTNCHKEDTHWTFEAC